MNLNHNPDEHLLEQIDKRLTTHQPSGSSVVDDLASTVPVPREAFQQALEARLLAKMETLPEGETIMTAKSVYVPIRSARRGWLPLTLLAAMLVIVIAVGVILVGSRPTSSEIALAQPSPSATATPVPADPVVSVLPANLPIDRTAIEVPLALLTEDSLLPKVGDSVDILALLPFTEVTSNIADVPSTALPDGTRLVEKFVVFGASVLTGGNQEQTLVVSVPSDEGRLLAWLIEQGITLRLQTPMNNDLPTLGNRRVIDIPRANVTTSEPIQVGDMVDVYSTCALTADGAVDCAQPAETNITQAIVVIGEIAGEGQEPRVQTEVIGLAVSQDSSEHLSVLNDLGMQFRLAKTGEANPAMIVPPGKVAISLPVSSLTLPEGANFAIGDTVDVMATYLMVDVGDAPSEFQRLITPEAGETNQVTQRMAEGTLIIGMSDTPVSTIILAVTRQEATILEWVIDAQLPMSLQPSTAAEAPLQTGSRIVNIPVNSITNLSSDIKTGDWVEVRATCVLVPETTDTNNVITPAKADCIRAAGTLMVRSGLVLFPYVSPTDPNTPVLPVAVSWNEEANLLEMIDAGMRFNVVRVDNPYMPTETPVLVPDGKVAISVPMTSLKMLDGETFAVGDTVDVITVASGVDIGTATGELQQMTTPEGEPDVTAKGWTSMGARGAVILTLNEVVQSGGFEAASLAVSPQEATIIQAALEMGNPITLRQSTAGAEPASPYTLQLPLNALAHWTTNALTVGDRVDLVMGFVLGDGEQVMMNFKPYDVYTWGDEISEGTVSAQVFAPMNDTLFGPAFLRRVIRGAVITSMRVSRDATTGRLSDVLVVLELPAGTSSQSFDEVKGFIEAGMPYLLLKP